MNGALVRNVKSQIVTPPNFWRNAKNRRELFEKIAAAKGRNPLDPQLWYSLNSTEVSQFKGVAAALAYYRTYEDAIVNLFPEIRFDRSKFRYKHCVEIWNKIQTPESRKLFFDNFAMSYGFDPLVPENWYHVSSHELRKHEGYKAILQIYGGKLHSCLMQVYPDIGLEESKFNFSSKWEDRENRKSILLQFATVNSFDPSSAETWYSKSLTQLESVPEIRSMLHYYKGDHVAALIDLFPDIDLDPSKFSAVPNWKDVNSRKELFCEIARQHDFDPYEPVNWYSFSHVYLSHKSAKHIVKKYYNGNIANGLLHMFPNISLDKNQFLQESSAILPKPSHIDPRKRDEYSNYHQEHLLVHLKSIFPNEKAIVNARKESKLKYSPDQAQYLELDIWFPNFDLCFEYQDSYHYVAFWPHQNPLQHVQERDNIKKDIVSKNNITVIAIPCWWDGSRASLEATIAFHRPDLISKFAKETLHLNPALDFFKNIDVPGVGGLMAATFPQSFKVSAGTDVLWWLGEKYDGIRCCWVPKNNAVYTRHGIDLQIQPMFIRFLPQVATDAELWAGRGMYSLTYKIFTGPFEFISWDMLRMVAFDAVPNCSITDFQFETRYKNLLASACNDNPLVIVAGRLFCNGQMTVDKCMKEIIEDGGEGVILRRFGSRYEFGTKSPSLLKLKTSLGDQEGIITSVHNSSLKLQLPNGVKFSVPSENIHLKEKPHAGEIVTFSYKIHSREAVPVAPVIYRKREDVTWDDLTRITS
eukprot:Phypoly_transcript_02324.p1 GENE.Phypoly_transcript_02324~~Phypoly_transcript_02324.p1  ORF type:complete len:754 (+),score=90.25 Phypoly_transcript_02324:5-2266(+)